jgi:hypothetical protein
MRLWIIHPRYLDCKGLVALWREGLLARRVLEGKTRGYRHHPQLKIFKSVEDPIMLIDTYLSYVLEEAGLRHYNFNKDKIGKISTNSKIEVDRKVVLTEFEHLKNKLSKRDHKKYEEIMNVKEPEVNPLFTQK